MFFFSKQCQICHIICGNITRRFLQQSAHINIIKFVTKYLDCPVNYKQNHCHYKKKIISSTSAYIYSTCLRALLTFVPSWKYIFLMCWLASYASFSQHRCNVRSCCRGVGWFWYCNISHSFLPSPHRHDERLV